jgi:hypothetical protein
MRVSLRQHGGISQSSTKPLNKEPPRRVAQIEESPQRHEHAPTQPVKIRILSQFSDRVLNGDKG